tara:strand:- start:190 stop:432 length:243 start_codon:yes stop_codon:yes gene_type:complete
MENLTKECWELIHWPEGGRAQLCQTKEVAERLLSTMTNPEKYILRPVRFTKTQAEYKWMSADDWSKRVQQEIIKNDNDRQ